MKLKAVLIATFFIICLILVIWFKQMIDGYYDAYAGVFYPQSDVAA